VNLLSIIPEATRPLWHLSNSRPTDRIGSRAIPGCIVPPLLPRHNLEPFVMRRRHPDPSSMLHSLAKSKKAKQTTHINFVVKLLLGNVVISNFSYAHARSWWCIATRGEYCLCTQRRPTAEAMTRRRRSSRTSSQSNRSSTETTAPSSFSTRSARWRSPDSDPAKRRGRVPLARRCGDDLDVQLSQGFA